MSGRKPANCPFVLSRLCFGESHSRFGDYDKSIRKLVRVFLQQATKHINFVGGAFIGLPEKRDALMRVSFAIDFFSKVLVVGDQDPVFLKCLLNNPVVVNTPRLVEDRKDIVLLVAQPPRYFRTRTFINEKAHFMPPPPSKA